MRKQQILAGIAILLLCIVFASAGSAGVNAVSKEQNGKITQTDWLDENGEPAAGPEGYATVRYTYKGSNTIEQYYDTQGYPYEVSGGYCGKRVQADSKGRTVEIEYLDGEGHRTLNKAGYAMTGISYYGFGEVKMVTYYGLNKKAVMVPSLGYASVLNEYSGKTLTSRTFRDTKGNPVDNADGYAVLKQKVNKRYAVLSIRYDHADGSPAAGPDGWFRCVKDRDDQDRLLSVKYYDTDMNLIDRGAGYAWEGYAYEGDSIVKVTRYDLNGQPVTDAAGVATLVREMKDGLVRKESFLDSGGNRINNTIGVAEIVYSYDHAGSLEKVFYQDTSGSPVNCSLGYAGYRDVKDEDGITVSRTFLGTDGLAAELPGGYCEIRYVYDETKQLVSVRYYDLNGKQIENE